MLQDPNDEDDDESSEVDRFSYFKWRGLHDMTPFRLSGGQIGIFESIFALVRDIQPNEILIALFAGDLGSWPCVMTKEASSTWVRAMFKASRMSRPSKHS